MAHQENTNLTLYNVESNTPAMKSADAHSAILKISMHELLWLARFASDLERQLCGLRVQFFPNAHIRLVLLHETLNSPVPNVYAEDLHIFQLRLSSYKLSRVAVSDNIKRRVETRTQLPKKETFSRGAVCVQTLLGWGVVLRDISEMHATCLLA